MAFLPWDKRNRGMRGLSPFDWVDDFFQDFTPFKGIDTFRMDVKETDKEYLIEAELPGVNKEDVNISLNDGQLTIAVKQTQQKDEENANYIRRERRVGTMQRTVYLCNASNKGANAKFKDGILSLRIPKDDSEKIYKIDID
ncbi:MAG: Hsp20/alpha crystallin family protein [Clostridiales bacterium]|nr:Hsp20/alpha crystallin family protein [Clostridiales bacterium]